MKNKKQTKKKNVSADCQEAHFPTLTSKQLVEPRSGMQFLHKLSLHYHFIILSNKLLNSRSLPLQFACTGLPGTHL